MKGERTQSMARQISVFTGEKLNTSFNTISGKIPPCSLMDSDKLVLKFTDRQNTQMSYQETEK